jgi:hypothetical protein
MEKGEEKFIWSTLRFQTGHYVTLKRQRSEERRVIETIIAICSLIGISLMRYFVGSLKVTVVPNDAMSLKRTHGLSGCDWLPLY